MFVNRTLSGVFGNLCLLESKDGGGTCSRPTRFGTGGDTAFASPAARRAMIPQTDAMHMDDFYTPTQRALQDRFGARPLADGLAESIVAPTLAPLQIDFIEGRDSFYLATVDDAGFPSVSYKGGAPGFVRVLDPGTLVFPSYDGNGMFMSMGNIDGSAKLGLLFIDFETPQRLRVRGEARVLHEGPVLDSYPGAQLAVGVSTKVRVNCPRYVHRMAREASRYVQTSRGWRHCRRGNA